MQIQMESDTIDILNRKIGGEYVTIDGHKIFRIVWSESIFENRYGTFREFTESGLFIREVTEVKRVRKYNYIHNRWIFEAWAPGHLTANRETPDAVNGDYIPVYVFEDRGGNYLPPNEKVVRFLIDAFYGKVKRDELPSSEYLEQREIARMEESMDDHPAWFQTRPGDTRNAIGYERRATFSPEAMINKIALRETEEKARKKAREREAERELERVKVEAAVRETARLREMEREKERDFERRATMIRESELRQQAANAEMARLREVAERRMEERVEIVEQEVAAPMVTKSPMHRGQ